MKTKKTLSDDLSPSADRSLRFALDALLRRYGFAIHARRKQLDPIWDRCGILYSQYQALRSLPEGEVADARYLGEMYYGDAS